MVLSPLAHQEPDQLAGNARKARSLKRVWTLLAMGMGMGIKASLVLGDGGGVFVHPRDDCFQLAVGFGQVYVEVGQGGEDLIVEIVFAHIGIPWVDMGGDEDTSRTTAARGDGR